MKNILLMVTIIIATSCATSNGCGYAKAKKFNDRQMRKAKRHRAANDIHNPENYEFVVEVAFNEDVDPQDVTQEMFDARYGVE